MLVKKDLEGFLKLQSDMDFIKQDDRIYIIKGIYHLSASYNDICLFDDFNILIKIPQSYPNNLPQVSSIGNSLPERFEHFYTNGEFCLGSPMELHLSAIDKNISSYLIKHLDAYLYSAVYFRKYNGQFPFGERSHGSLGIIEFWEEYLCTEDIEIIYNILKYISLNKYRGHNLCPCGSKNKLRNCHGNKILPIIKKSLSLVAKNEVNLFEKEVSKSLEQHRKNTSRL